MKALLAIQDIYVLLLATIVKLKPSIEPITASLLSQRIKIDFVHLDLF